MLWCFRCGRYCPLTGNTQPGAAIVCPRYAAPLFFFVGSIAPPASGVARYAPTDIACWQGGKEKSFSAHRRRTSESELKMCIEPYSDGYPENIHPKIGTQTNI